MARRDQPFRLTHESIRAQKTNQKWSVCFLRSNSFGVDSPSLPLSFAKHHSDIRYHLLYWKFRIKVHALVCWQNMLWSWSFQLLYVKVKNCNEFWEVEVSFQEKKSIFEWNDLLKTHSILGFYLWGNDLVLKKVSTYLLFRFQIMKKSLVSRR